jgi:hypothetical protein
MGVPKKYNQGGPTDRREALRTTVAYTTLLTTLATGTIVLSATFLDKFYTGHDIGLLIASWAILGISILAGLVAIGDSVNQFAESTLKVRRSAMEVANLCQFLLLIIGLILFAVFVTSNVTAAPAIRLDRDRSGIEGTVGETTVVCPSSAPNGCTGTVTFELITPRPNRPVSLGTEPFATAHAGLITVYSPRKVESTLTGALIYDRLRIVVQGQGKYGTTITLTESVPARRTLTVG